MFDSTEYLDSICKSKEKVIIHMNFLNVQKEEPQKYIGIIKYSLDDGIVLEASSMYNEVFIHKSKILSVRKWTEKK